MSAELATGFLQHAGFHVEWVRHLRHVWSKQYRWIHLLNFTCPQAVQVCTSIPQGCAMAPLAMVLYLAEAETAVTRMARANGFFQQISFIDDRNFAVDPPASLQQVCTSWRQWCQWLGLKENHHKMKVLCKSLDLVQQIRDSGFEHTCFVDNLLCLVLTLEAMKCHSIVKREEVAQTIWRRLALLPVSMAQKRSLFRSRAVPLLTWGWWLVSPQIGFCKTWMGNMKTAVCNLNNLASHELWHILEGHWTNPMFISGQEAVKNYFRAEKFWRDQVFGTSGPPAWPSSFTILVSKSLIMDCGACIPSRLIFDAMMRFLKLLWIILHTVCVKHSNISRCWVLLPAVAVLPGKL